MRVWVGSSSSSSSGLRCKGGGGGRERGLWCFCLIIFEMYDIYTKCTSTGMCESVPLSLMSSDYFLNPLLAAKLSPSSSSSSIPS